MNFQISQWTSIYSSLHNQRIRISSYIINSISNYETNFKINLNRDKSNIEESDGDLTPRSLIRKDLEYVTSFSQNFPSNNIYSLASGPLNFNNQLSENSISAFNSSSQHYPLISPLSSSIKTSSDISSVSPNSSISYQTTLPRNVQSPISLSMSSISVSPSAPIISHYSPDASHSSKAYAFTFHHSNFNSSLLLPQTSNLNNFPQSNQNSSINVPSYYSFQYK
jgi:hypothetical protein